MDGGEPRELAGKVAVVTGGSSGIGRATAACLVAAGASVLVTGRQNEHLAEAVKDMESGSAMTLVADVRHPRSGLDAMHTAARQWGRVDIVIVNAGIGYYGGILEASDEQVRGVVETNLLGTIYTIRAAIQQFRQQNQGGDIIIVSSAAALRGRPDEAVYAATKHAQLGFASCVDREVRGEGIRLMNICPAGTSTAFAKNAGREFDPRSADYMSSETVAETICCMLKQPASVRLPIVEIANMASDRFTD